MCQKKWELGNSVAKLTLSYMAFDAFDGKSVVARRSWIKHCLKWWQGKFGSEPVKWPNGVKEVIRKELGAIESMVMKDWLEIGDSELTERIEDILALV